MIQAIVVVFPVPGIPSIKAKSKAIFHGREGQGQERREKNREGLCKKNK